VIFNFFEQREKTSQAFRDALSSKKKSKSRNATLSVAATSTPTPVPIPGIPGVPLSLLPLMITANNLFPNEYRENKSIYQIILENMR
jgi:hypothetical protein